MSWFGTQKQTKAKAKRAEAVRLSRGSTFKALDEFYSKPETCADWHHIRSVRDNCGHDEQDEVDFYLRLFNYVRLRGGRTMRKGHGIFVSAQLPHQGTRGGAIYPAGSDTLWQMDPEPRMTAALKKLGVR